MYNEHIAFELVFLTFAVFALANSLNSYFSNGSIDIYSIILIIVSFIFLGIIIFKSKKIRLFLMKKYVKNRCEHQKIAILDGRIHELMSHTIPITRFSIRKWKKRLEDDRLKVDLISISRISNDYSMIINPFGGVYIEEDFSNLKTFMRIKKYIHDGGVFINVKDLAFWKSWNSRNNTGGITSPGVETYEINTGSMTILQHNILHNQLVLQPRLTAGSLIDTCLFKNFGVHTTTFFTKNRNLIATPIADFLRDIGEMDITEFRAAINCEKENMEFYRLFSTRLDQVVGEESECFPVAALKYYMGYLVLFGMDITSERDFDFECKIIKKINEKLSLAGSL